MTMSNIQDVPRSLVLNGISFFAADINYLKSLFPVYDFVTLLKSDIRQNSILQKAMMAEAVVCNMVQTDGDSAMLSLSQDGRLLLEKY
jgi:hypothetical protein